MDDLWQYCRAVLLTADPMDKAEKALQVTKMWQTDQLIRPENPPQDWPDCPARPTKPALLPPNKMPRRRTKGLTGRIGLLHALAHIELNAIDLAFDMLGRFASTMPDERFIADWLKVGADEARHFSLLNGRLNELGAAYGDLPAHDGLWEAADATKHDLLARLAIVPMVLEARGLDVTPPMIEKLTAHGDTASAVILDTIYRDEKTHVRIGSQWFMTLCQQQNKTPQSCFKALVKTYFKGVLKPPFNTEARQEAGLPAHFYS